MPKIIVSNDYHTTIQRIKYVSVRISSMYHLCVAIALLLTITNFINVCCIPVTKDMKSFSTLDRFLVSPGLMPLILDAGAIHLGDNPSRHSPIMIKLSISR